MIYLCFISLHMKTNDKYKISQGAFIAKFMQNSDINVHLFLALFPFSP